MDRYSCFLSRIDLIDFFWRYQMPLRSGIFEDTKYKRILRGKLFRSIYSSQFSHPLDEIRSQDRSTREWVLTLYTNHLFNRFSNSELTTGGLEKTVLALENLAKTTPHPKG